MWYGYAGNFIIVALTELGAAYAITKIVYGIVKLSSSDHATSWGQSEYGNSLHLWEAITSSVFIVVSASIGYTGYLQANLLWRDYELKTSNSDTFTMIEGYKFLAMSFVIGVAGMLGGFYVGDIACSLWGWYDNYNTSLEGTANNADDADSKGTSFLWDFYAGIWLNTMFVLALTLAITVGGYDFAIYFLGHTWVDLLP